MRTFRTRAAFTLIELILYIGLTAMVVVSVMRIMLTVTGTREKTGTLHTVQHELRFVMDTISYTARNAVAVQTGSSVFNSATGTLVLTMSGTGINPTRFFLSGSNVYMQQASASAQALTSSRVLVDRLEFRNRSPANTYGTYRIYIHATDAVQDSDVTYDDDMTLQTTISLRQ